MTHDALEERDRTFLLALFDLNLGDPARQASMYLIGEQMGLEKSEARQTAENLMGEGLVEIRTLAGAVGLTADGVARSVALGAPPPPGTAPAAPRLGSDPLLADAPRGALEEILSSVRGRSASLALGFEAMGELVADMRSIEAQLASPRPKTAILRECLRSVAAVLSGGSGRDLAERIERFV